MTILKFRVYDKVECMMITTSDYEDLSDLFCILKNDTDTGYISELMQSTGLIDKNGEEIFEGDIVQDGGGDVGVVVYDKECGAYGLKYKSNLIITFDSLDRICDWYGSVVIGNIYETPELLEEVK